MGVFIRWLRDNRANALALVLSTTLEQFGALLEDDGGRRQLAGVGRGGLGGPVGERNEAGPAQTGPATIVARAGAGGLGVGTVISSHDRLVIGRFARWSQHLPPRDHAGMPHLPRLVSHVQRARPIMRTRLLGFTLLAACATDPTLPPDCTPGDLTCDHVTTGKEDGVTTTSGMPFLPASAGPVTWQSP